MYLSELMQFCPLVTKMLNKGVTYGDKRHSLRQLFVYSCTFMCDQTVPINQCLLLSQTTHIIYLHIKQEKSEHASLKEQCTHHLLTQELHFLQCQSYSQFPYIPAEMHNSALTEGRKAVITSTPSEDIVH